jgi:hypothetical protein
LYISCARSAIAGALIWWAIMALGAYVYLLFSKSEMHLLYTSAISGSVASLIAIPITYYRARSRFLAPIAESVAKAKQFASFSDNSTTSAGNYYAAGEDESDTIENEVPAAKDETCYEILGLSPGASKEEINAAYHERIKRSHPDKVADLDPEFRALAEQRAKRLNAAREEALRNLKVT